jgi:predicted TIM-barrel fold metal-dependent hydrolase
MDYVGADRFLWATDYPHSDHDAHYMTELHELAARLPAEARRQLLGENVAKAYRL